MRARWLGVSLALPALAPFVPAQSSLWTTYGTSGLDLFSTSMDAGGDYDGDAVPDLVVGMPGFVDNGTYAGRVLILSGATGAVVRTIQGGAHEGLGSVVAALSDVDGDLVPDVLASRSSLDVVRVLSGASGVTIRTHTGSVFQAFGAALGALGDVNADGRGDYAICAYTEGPAGVVRVYSGIDGALLQTHTGTGAPNGTLLRGDALGVGDLDADGRDDFALVHSTAPNGNVQGRVSIRSGATGAELLAFLGTLHTQFGSAARSGDLDGDGTAELLVGQGTSADVPGRVAAYSLATGAVVRTYPSPQPVNDDGFGDSVAALADVDQDGVPDVAAAGRGPRGAWVYSGATGALLQSYQRGGSCQGALRVVGLPDLDLDGRSELVIGEPCANYGAQPLTRVAVYPGATSTEHGAIACFGDGSSAPCPCANPGASGAGCANTTGVGAALRAHGSTSVARDDLWFDATGLPGNAGGSTYLFVGSSVAGGGAGIPNFGGLRCVGGVLVRLGQHHWKGAGSASWPSGLGAIGGWSAGSTRHFQSMYRDMTNPCSVANFTNLVTLTLAP